MPRESLIAPARLPLNSYVSRLDAIVTGGPAGNSRREGSERDNSDRHGI